MTTEEGEPVIEIPLEQLIYDFDTGSRTKVLRDDLDGSQANSSLLRRQAEEYKKTNAQLGGESSRKKADVKLLTGNLQWYEMSAAKRYFSRGIAALAGVTLGAVAVLLAVGSVALYQKTHETNTPIAETSSTAPSDAAKASSIPFAYQILDVRLNYDKSAQSKFNNEVRLAMLQDDSVQGLARLALSDPKVDNSTGIVFRPIDSEISFVSTGPELQVSLNPLVYGQIESKYAWGMKDRAADITKPDYMGYNYISRVEVGGVRNPDLVKGLERALSGAPITAQLQKSNVQTLIQPPYSIGEILSMPAIDISISRFAPENVVVIDGVASTFSHPVETISINDGTYNYFIGPPPDITFAEFRWNVLNQLRSNIK